MLGPVSAGQLEHPASFCYAEMLTKSLAAIGAAGTVARFRSPTSSSPRQWRRASWPAWERCRAAPAGAVTPSSSVPPWASCTGCPSRSRPTWSVRPASASWSSAPTRPPKRSPSLPGDRPGWWPSASASPDARLRSAQDAVDAVWRVDAVVPIVIGGQAAISAASAKLTGLTAWAADGPAAVDIIEQYARVGGRPG